MTTLRLGDVVTIERGTTYKSALIGQPGPVLLGLGTIQRNGGFRDDSLRTYGGDSPGRLLVQPGQLYASLKDVTQSADLLGAVARLPIDHEPGRLTQDTVRLDLIDDRVPAEYLYWILRTPQYRQYCRAHLTGTTNLGLPREDFFAFEFPKPTNALLNLAALLGAVEKRITSNQRLINLVPQVFRAHVNGALSDAPARVPVATLASFINGGAYTKGASGTGRMVLRIAELNSGPGGATVYNDIDVPDEKTARAGDLLMSWSGSLGLYRWFRDEAIINQHIFKVIPTGYPAWLVFDRLDAVMPVFRGVAADKATTMGHIQRGHLESTEVDLPGAVAIGELDHVLAPLWDRLLLAERENIKLTALRDALLHELLSGRVHIPAEGAAA